MSQEDKCWNVPLITSTFEPYSAAKILNTPLYSSVTEDRRLWRAEQNGEYSVRSAYRLCTQELIDTSHLRMNGAWNLIWEIKIPAKVKNFIWRICRRCIPTRVRSAIKELIVPLTVYYVITMMRIVSIYFLHVQVA
jgi:hypothetical protein